MRFRIGDKVKRVSNLMWMSSSTGLSVDIIKNRVFTVAQLPEHRTVMNSNNEEVIALEGRTEIFVASFFELALPRRFAEFDEVL